MRKLSHRDEVTCPKTPSWKIEGVKSNSLTPERTLNPCCSLLPSLCRLGPQCFSSPWIIRMPSNLLQGSLPLFAVTQPPSNCISFLHGSLLQSPLLHTGTHMHAHTHRHTHNMNSFKLANLCEASIRYNT